MLLLALTISACDQLGCSGGEVPPALEGDVVTEPDVPLVPADATVVMHGPNVESVLGVLAVATSKLPKDAAIPVMRGVWSANFAYDPFGTAGWEAWGFEPNNPFTLVRANGRWIAMSKTSDPEKFQRFVERRAEDGKLAIESGTFDGFEVWSISMTPPRGEGQIMLMARKGDLLFAVPTGRLDPRTTLGAPGAAWPMEELGKMLSSWSERPQDERWANDRAVKAMRGGWAQKSDVVGSMQPGEFIRKVDAKGQAASIRNRMISQLGTFQFAADVDAPSRSVTVRVRSEGNPDAPTFVRDLKGATGEVPRIGGLADPGILSIIRLSVNPDKTWQLLRSLLPAEDRLKIDQTFADLSKELSLDAKKLLLDNLHGHVFVFVYGFQEDVLSSENPTFIPDLFQLRATREAVLVPVKDTEKAKRFLDILTQLSKGKLNRQALGDSMQYAWIDDGPLEWAVIVGKDHAIVVDSSAAFDKATIYERGARKLPAALEARGADKLLDGAHRSGAYIDLAALANLLNETDNEAGPWLAPYTSVVVTTEMGESSAELTLEIGLERIPEPVDEKAGPAGSFEPL